jgi:phenylpropionate dioxygenase-like ring-hydroxylating dioxygenase large terminal subunit
MGDPAKAEKGKIPDLPWVSEAGWTATPGRLHVKSNYQFIVDNLLDFTHVAYVHKRTIAGDPREATEPLKPERLNDGIGVTRWLLDVQPPPLFANAGNLKSNVDRWQVARWHPPGVVYLDVGCAKARTGAPQGDRSQGISIWSTHLLTPETEHTSHYMFCFSRDFALEDEGMSKLLYEGSRATFDAFATRKPSHAFAAILRLRLHLIPAVPARSKGRRFRSAFRACAITGSRAGLFPGGSAGFS